MTKDTNNPFILPGFGQQGENAHNPLFAGLEMMNQAWQNLAQGNQVGTTPVMSLDELDKKIRELRTVQNWLQLNSTMLANTIQGLEIQRSTLSMMKSFATANMADTANTNTEPSQDYAKAAGEWWQILQQQFEQMAKATTESLQTMTKAAEPATAAKAGAKKSAKPKTSSKAATKSATKAASKTTSKSTRKS